jgi:hypothetical protein
MTALLILPALCVAAMGFAISAAAPARSPPSTNF